VHSDPRRALGRTYTIKLECMIAGLVPLFKTVSVVVPPAGRMHGEGEMLRDSRVRFEFELQESNAGADSGRLRVLVGKASVRDSDDRKGGARGEHGRDDRINLQRERQVLLYNVEGSRLNGNAAVNSVEAKGRGSWNGKAGYMFKLRATDAGEPGAGRDTMLLEIRDAQGSVVLRRFGTIDAGNIDAQKAGK
jgi:hypothetical protein